METFFPKPAYRADEIAATRTMFSGVYRTITHNTHLFPQFFERVPKIFYTFSEVYADFLWLRLVLLHTGQKNGCDIHYSPLYAYFSLLHIPVLHTVHQTQISTFISIPNYVFPHPFSLYSMQALQMLGSVSIPFVAPGVLYSRCAVLGSEKMFP